MSNHTFVIAECGSCHDGDLDKAYRLIEAAKACGADAAKFQYWSSPERLAERRNAPESLDTYRRYSFPPMPEGHGWLYLLWKHCDKVGIEFMCTAYLPEDIPIVADYVKRFKIASFEHEDQAFFDAHLSYGKPIVVSAGLCGVQPPCPLSVPRDAAVYFMHCVSAYPCPLEQANLRAILYSPAFKHRGLAHGFAAGYSDHTTSTLTGALAVVLGAAVIEKHLRLVDTDLENPDAPHSLWSEEGNTGDFGEYVRNIRDAERAMGDGQKRIMPCEEPMLRYKVKP